MPWASRNGTPSRTSRSAMSVAARNSSDAAAAMRSRSKLIAGRASRRAASQAQLERVDRVEQLLLVLLHVLVVGERQAVQHAVQRRQAAQPRAAPWPRSSSAASGFFFCGIRLEPEEKRVGDLAEAELLARPEHDLRAEPRQVRGAGGRGATGSRARSRGWRRRRASSPRRRRSRARWATNMRLGVEVHAGQRARRRAAGRRWRVMQKLKRCEVAAEHPEVGQQVVREVDRLGALEVGVAGHRPVEVALGERRPAWPSARCSSSRASQAVRAHEHAPRRWRPGRCASGRCAACRPPAPTSSVSRRSIAMWMSSSSGSTTKRSGLELLAHAGRDRARSARGPSSPMIPLRRQHPRVRQRLLDVVRREPLVERDRRVQRLEERVLRLGEADMRAVYARPAVVDCRPSRDCRPLRPYARPGRGAAAARCLHESAADMYDRFAGGRERALRALDRAFDSPGTPPAPSVVWVAEVDGEVVGGDGRLPGRRGGRPLARLPAARAARLAALALARRAAPVPRRRPRHRPSPPAAAFYVDALATDPALPPPRSGPRAAGRGRARGARAGAARRRARHGIENDAARALYASEGFDEVAYRPAARGLPGSWRWSSRSASA